MSFREFIRNPRILLAFVYDVIVCLLASIVSINLRYGVLDPFEAPIKNFPIVVLLSTVSGAICFYFAGLYRGIWRFSSTPDLIRVFKGATFAVGSSFGVIFLYNRLETVPRSAFLINWLLLIIGLGAGRFVYRLWRDSKQYRVNKREHQKNGKVTNIVLVGAGQAGVRILSDIKLNPTLGYNVVGFVDDDPLKHNRLVLGVKVLGATSQLSEYVKKLNVSKVFIAIPSATGKQIRDIIQQCEKLNIEFKTLPKLNQILSEKVDISLLRNVRFEDLLGREPIQLDVHSIKEMITEKRVLITGAGGSIGSELCRQIAAYRPSSLICFEISEYFMFELENELKQSFPSVNILPVIGDVRDREKLDIVFEKYKPNIILHAAAYKHVPMMELNPIEAIRTNVQGTRNVSEMSVKHQANKMVLISTDKAVNPTNVMGCTKRVAEIICQLQGESQKSTEFITVRFGNVLGSNGSVIPLFRRQIEERKNVTVTHPDMERYFMSIPEASLLVLQAATMGRGGEIFVLDMGEPVKIVDLAKEMIKLAGLELGQDIDIVFTGLRPGEKLYEELFSSEENLIETFHSKVRRANVRKHRSEWSSALNEILALPPMASKTDIILGLKKLVPEFNHQDFSDVESENPTRIH